MGVGKTVIRRSASNCREDENMFSIPRRKKYTVYHLRKMTHHIDSDLNTVWLTISIFTIVHTRCLLQLS